MALDFKDSYPIVQWNLNNNTLYKHYNGSVDDTGNGFKLQIRQGEDVLFPSTEKAFFYFEKKDGTNGYIDSTIDENYFVFDLTNQVYAIKGIVECNFQINSGDKWRTSKTFTIEVNDNNIAKAIESSNDFIALQHALATVNQSVIDVQNAVVAVNEAIDNTQIAIDKADISTSNANEAATNANLASNVAIEKANLAESAANSVTSAIAEANLAINNAKNATTDALTATTSANEAAETASTAANTATLAASRASDATDEAHTVATLLENETLEIRKDAVENYSDLETTYPVPENGWTVTVKRETVSYRYNGFTSTWVNLGYISTVDIATETTLGIVKGGGNVIIGEDGTLNAPDRTTFEKAGGTTAEIILTDITLQDGISKTFIALYSDTTTTKTINGKPWYKPGTTTSPPTTAGKAYTVWYDLSGDCFFIKASAGGGTATKADVLATATFSSDTVDEESGTIPIKSAATYTPGTTDKIIAAGQFLGGDQIVKGDANLIPGNISTGIKIFGVSGTLDNTVITGQTTAQGVCTEEITKGNLVTTRRHFGSDTLVALTYPTTLPTDSGYSVTFSSDGIYMAVAHSVTPYITIYKRSGDTFTKLPNPTTLPTGSSNSVAFSSDGIYMAVGHYTSPYITIYKRSGDTFTKLPDPATLPIGSSYSVTFSSDGIYMAVGHYTSPYITIYKRSVDTFTKLPNPTTLPTGGSYGVAFSSDGIYMAVAHFTTPYIAIYKRSGDTFTKLPNPTTLPTGGSNSVVFSSDGIYMAVGHTNTPYITIYKRSGDTFTKLPDPATLPTGGSYSVAFSPNGIYIAVAHSVTPYITIYKCSGDTFTKLPNPTTLPIGNGKCVGFSPNGIYMAVAHFTTPFITIYKADLQVDYLYKYTSLTDFNNSNYINFGFAKSNGTVDSAIDITTIPIK